MRPFIRYDMKDMSDYNETVSSKTVRQRANDIRTSPLSDGSIPIQILLRKIPS